MNVYGISIVATSIFSIASMMHHNMSVSIAPVLDAATPIFTATTFYYAALNFFRNMKYSHQN